MIARAAFLVRWVGRVTVGALVAALAVALPSVAAQAAYSATPRASWTPTTGTVYALERVGNTIVMGGNFTALRGPTGTPTVQRNRLAAIDASTGDLLDWNPGADDTVRALEASADGSTVFIGGDFRNLAGVARNRLAAVTVPGGTLVTGFNPNANNQVRSLERVGSTVYAGGTFTTLGGQSHVRVAAISEATGIPVPGWNASADASVAALHATLDGSKLILGGLFHNISGQSRDFIGSVDAATGAVTTWRTPIPCTDTQNPCYVYDLAVDLGSVYAGIGGPGGRVSAYDLGSGQRRWANYTDGDVQSIAIEGSTLYAGGHFDTDFGGQPRAGIVTLSTATGAVNSDFAPLILNGLGLFDILVPGSDWCSGADLSRCYLRVGGGFTRVDANTARQRYAEFPSNATPPDNQPPTVPGNLHTTNVSDTRVSLAWNASSDNDFVAGYRVSRDGQVVANLGSTAWTDTSTSPNTTYVYTVEATDPAGNSSGPSAPLSVTTSPPSTSLIKVGSPWRYLSNGSDQGTAWLQSGFNDSSWSLGEAQLGFGEGDETTVISPLGLTHYFRQSFNVADRASVASLTGRLLRDDGAIVYLNGTEVWRSNMPTGAVNYQTPAATDVTGAAENTFFQQGIPTSALVNGTNVIAVEIHNRTGSTDVSFDFELVPTIVPVADNEAPSAPQSLAAPTVTSTSVGLTWTAATDNVGVTGYRVFRNGVALPSTAASTSYTDSGLTPDTPYTYTVRALDAAGNVSLDSNQVSVTTSPAQTGGTVFTEGWQAADGSPWQSAWATTSGSGGSVSVQNNQGRLGLQNQTGAFARAQLAGPASVSDSEALFSYQWSSNTAASYFSVFLRGSGGWQNTYRPLNGYGLQLSSTSGAVIVQRNVSGTLTTLSTVAAGQQVTTAKQWMRFRVQGSQLMFRRWADGNPEPATWTYTGADSAVTAPGQLFLSHVRASTNVAARDFLLDDLSLTSPPPA